MRVDSATMTSEEVMQWRVWDFSTLKPGVIYWADDETHEYCLAGDDQVIDVILKKFLDEPLGRVVKADKYVKIFPENKTIFLNVKDMPDEDEETNFDQLNYTLY